MRMSKKYFTKNKMLTINLKAQGIFKTFVNISFKADFNYFLVSIELNNPKPFYIPEEILILPEIRHNPAIISSSSRMNFRLRNTDATIDNIKVIKMIPRPPSVSDFKMSIPMKKEISFHSWSLVKTIL